MVVGLRERGAEVAKSEAVDEALALEMLKSLVDRDQPAVAVLLSGDGGFKEHLVPDDGQGLGAEVLCFSCIASPEAEADSPWFRWPRQIPVKLDPWCPPALTYRQELTDSGTPRIARESEPLDLKKVGPRCSRGCVARQSGGSRRRGPVYAVG